MVTTAKARIIMVVPIMATQQQDKGNGDNGNNTTIK
jgi:hypothetical protein